MNIVFLIGSLRGAGAERVASTLCNHWASNQHQVTIITFDDVENDFYQSNAAIVRYGLNSNVTASNIIKKIYANLKRLIRIRQIIKEQQPDVVMSFMSVPNMQAILACLFTGIPVVISERMYPPYFNHNDSFDRIRKALYKLSSAFVAQTNIVAQWGADFLKATKIAVIANPLDRQVFISDTTVTRTNTIMAMGRLSTDKGFDLLIQAFARIHEYCPTWNLQIVGEGSERHHLQQQIAALGVNAKVQLVGQSPTPKSHYAAAKIFVLSSRVEGFPNVLIEAMANGLPVISFDCNSGPAQIINDGVNGLLVPANNIESLSAALQRLINDVQLRDNLAAEAIKVRDKYRIDVISEQWFKIFDAVVEKAECY